MVKRARDDHLAEIVEKRPRSHFDAVKNTDGIKNDRHEKKPPFHNYQSMRATQKMQQKRKAPAKQTVRSSVSFHTALRSAMLSEESCRAVLAMLQQFIQTKRNEHRAASEASKKRQLVAITDATQNEDKIAYEKDRIQHTVVTFSDIVTIDLDQEDDSDQADRSDNDSNCDRKHTIKDAEKNAVFRAKIEEIDQKCSLSTESISASNEGIGSQWSKRERRKRLAAIKKNNREKYKTAAFSILKHCHIHVGFNACSRSLESGRASVIVFSTVNQAFALAQSLIASSFFHEATVVMPLPCDSITLARALNSDGLGKCFALSVEDDSSNQNLIADLRKFAVAKPIPPWSILVHST